MFEWISVVTQVGVLAVLVEVARQLRQINAKTGVSFYVGDRGRHFSVNPLRHTRHVGPDQIAMTFSIWAYRGGSWVLLKPCGQANCGCGPEPAKPGEYEG